MATSSMSAARRFVDTLVGRDESSREGIVQIIRALDLAEAHDAREVTPAKPERPLHERALASVNAYATRLPKASVDLLFEAMARLAVLERERSRPPRPGIQVEVADDLDVMSLEELCERFNAQRQSIKEMYAAQDRMDGKLRAIRKLSTET